MFPLRSDRACALVLALATAFALATAVPLTAAAAAQPRPQPQSQSQFQPPAPPPTAPTAREEEPVHISADQAEGGTGITVLTGHVVIQQGSATLTGETGVYDRDHHHQSLQGHVRYTDKTLSVTSLTADNYDDERRVVLTGGVVVTDTSGTLEGSQATYYRKEGRMLLEGQVKARDRERTITAQRLTYYKDAHLLVAEGNVRVDDKENEALLEAPSLEYNRDTRVLRVPAASRLQVMDEGKATLITSDSLTYESRSHVARAFGHVRISRDSLTAESGLATVFRDSHLALLTGSPRASDMHGTTEGDTLELHWTGREIRRVVAVRSAKATYTTRPNSNREETSVATGDRVVLALENQKARTLTVVGHARDEFHGRDLVTQEEDVNTSEGDSIVVDFKDNHARVATVLNGHTGRYQYRPGAKKGTAEDVRYTAERIDYDLDHDKVYLRQNARLEYKDLILNADSVDYDMKRSVLVARGNPRLKDANQEIEGQQMGYDLKHEQGSVLHGRTTYASGFYTGESIKKVSENVLNVNGGDYSTCDDPHPHYRIRSPRMKIYLHDKVVLEPVIFYLRDLPILALPFYVFPIREGRHSGIIFPQFDFGLSSTQGKFIRNAGYYWAISDYLDASLYGDYYQDQPRWIGYLQTRYKVRYLLEGNFYSSLSKDIGTGQRQWQLQATHQQQLGEKTALSMNADFISDAGYLQNQGLGLPPEARVSRTLHSLLALSHNWQGGTLNLALDRRQNLAVDTTDTLSETLSEQLPSLQLALSSRPLGRAADAAGQHGRLPFLSTTYYSFTSRLAREVHQTRLRGSDHAAFGNNLSLNDTRRILGWLNFGPSFNLSHALVDQDALGRRWAQGVVWQGAFNMSTTFYGAFQPHWGPFEGLRHVLSPAVSYVFQPEFKNLTFADTAGVLRNRFPGVAGVGLSAVKQSRMDMSVGNTFQLKLRHGTDIKRLDNFANLSLNTSYDFLWREHAQRPWSQVNASLHVYPGPVGGFDAGAVYDPYHLGGRSITQFSFSTNLSRTGRFSGGFAHGFADTSRLPGATSTAVTRTAVAPSSIGTWSVSLSYSYTGSANRGAFFGSTASTGPSGWTQTQRLNSHLTYQLSPNWHFDYSNNFDLSHGISVYQEISAQRDLHCWQASFTRRIQAGSPGAPGTSEYYFRISVKNRPELSYQSGSSGLGGLLGGGSGLGGLFSQ